MTQPTCPTMLDDKRTEALTKAMAGVFTLDLLHAAAQTDPLERLGMVMDAIARAWIRISRAKRHADQAMIDLALEDET